MVSKMKISEKALNQLKAMKEATNNYIRLSLKGSGCAGFSYKFEFAENKESFEKIIEDVLLVDELYYHMLDQSIVDYIDNGFEKYFYLNITNAKSKCGCGKSFSI